jgi:hypothetical protein
VFRLTCMMAFHPRPPPSGNSCLWRAGCGAGSHTAARSGRRCMPELDQGQAAAGAWLVVGMCHACPASSRSSPQHAACQQPLLCASQLAPGDTQQPWLDQAWSQTAHEQPISAFLTSIKVGTCVCLRAGACACARRTGHCADARLPVWCACLCTAPAHTGVPPAGCEAQHRCQQLLHHA